MPQMQNKFPQHFFVEAPSLHSGFSFAQDDWDWLNKLHNNNSPESFSPCSREYRPYHLTFNSKRVNIDPGRFSVHMWL